MWPAVKACFSRISVDCTLGLHGLWGAKASANVRSGEGVVGGGVQRDPSGLWGMTDTIGSLGRVSKPVVGVVR